MPDAKTILDEIIEYKFEELDKFKAQIPLNDLRARVLDLPQTSPGEFKNAISAGKPVSLIAEIKKASPSKGLIREDFDPPSLAIAYRKGGASALSVLTDEKFFRGQNSYLAAAIDFSGLPALRKDFTVDPYQIYQARILGASAILLIVAALEQSRLEEYYGIAHEIGLDCLVEVHDEDEAERAVKLGADIIGVNNRNLKTFVTTLDVSKRLAPILPGDAVLVSESGITTFDDLKMLAGHGFSAVLVGEHLMRQPDVRIATRQLLTGRK